MAPVKLLLTWDIQEDREKVCLEFMATDLGPGLQRLGVQLTDAWYTQVGDGPEIVVGGTVESREAAVGIIASADFIRLRERLQRYAEHLDTRIVGAEVSGLQF